MKNWLLVLALVAAIGAPNTDAAGQTTSAAAGERPQANFDSANTRSAANSSISSSNVGRLGVASSFGVTGMSAFGALAPPQWW
jgi:hypothetical protein